MCCRVVSLTISGRCKARDTVATDTLAAAAISLTVRARAGCAPALGFGPSIPCRLRLELSPLTSRDLLLLHCFDDTTRPQAGTTRAGGLAPSPVGRALMQCNIMDYMKSLHRLSGF